MAAITRHVVRNTTGGWSVRKGGAARASKVFDTQTAAIDYAVNLAKRERAELYIHRQDGTIREKRSYGNDPYPPRDSR